MIQVIQGKYYGIFYGVFYGSASNCKCSVTCYLGSYHLRETNVRLLEES